MYMIIYHDKDRHFVGVNKQHNESSPHMPQGSPIDPSFFLLYINDQPESILRSLVNVYARGMAVYECISKTLDMSLTLICHLT